MIVRASAPRLCLVAALGLALAACKTPGSTRAPKADDPDAAAATGDAGEGQPREPIIYTSVGQPHGAPITQIALDPTGSAALTRDGSGGVRLWPALDGSREPLVVPIRDPREMSLAAVDGEAGGWTLALIDGAGGARIVGASEDGRMVPHGSLPPTTTQAELMVLPGGERLLGVGDDHVLRLYDRQGKELASLEQAKLRPSQLRVALEAEGGPKIFAITAGTWDDGQGRFAVELLPLKVGADSLEFADGRQTILLDVPPTRDNPSISPDGRTAVYTRRQRKGGASWTVTAMQLDDGRSLTQDSETGAGGQPRMGLLAGGRVLIDDASGIGRVVDLGEREVRLHPLRTSPTANHMTTVFAGGKRVAAVSDWLMVHELDEDELRYLGYRQVNVTDAGLSPTGERVAWALGDRLTVEAVGSGELLEVPGTRSTGRRFVAFVDDDTLLALDWAGGAELLRWRDGEILDAVDLGGNVQEAELAIDDQGRGVIFVRTNLWQNPTLVELAGVDDFGPRHLLSAAANQAGLLAPRDQGPAQWGGWSLDQSGTLHRFPLARMREGVNTQEAVEDGERLESGVPERLVLDGAGHMIWFRTEGSRPVLHLVDPDSPDERQTKLPPGFVSRLAPSADGSRLAVVQQRDPGQILTIYDLSSLEPLWAQPVPAANGLSWSADGSAIALAGQFGGGVVFDADEGSVASSRCGLGFEARRSPPVVQGFTNQISACGL